VQWHRRGYKLQVVLAMEVSSGRSWKAQDQSRDSTVDPPPVTREYELSVPRIQSELAFLGHTVSKQPCVGIEFDIASRRRKLGGHTCIAT